MRLSIIVLTASAAYGAVGNLQVRGVTSTQAILAYTAPDTNPCSVEVSESQSYRPLAHDVDPALFAGSNLDNRPEATGSGIQRVFVAGKRRAEKGTTGRWYSRALQAFTTHYLRITCGVSQVTGTFLTANIALGNTYNEALPADPAVSARPYFSSTGSYALPEFLNWNNQDPAARPESVIDPQTGMLLKRLALPQDQPITYLPGGGDHNFYSVFDPDGAWNVPAVIWMSPAAPAADATVTLGLEVLDAYNVPPAMIRKVLKLALVAILTWLLVLVETLPVKTKVPLATVKPPLNVLPLDASVKAPVPCLVTP